MNFVNLTNKPIIILGEENQELLRLPEGRHVVNAGIVVNIVERHETTTGGSVKVATVSYQADISEIPDPKKDTYYVVKYAVLKALNNSRADVVAPDTSPDSIVKDGLTGKIIGVKRFCKL
jgi:hypothetical protein